MQFISDKGIGVNVHYVPLPMLTLFRKHGFSIDDFPMSYRLYENEITLPLYNDLSTEDAVSVAEATVAAYSSILDKAS